MSTLTAQEIADKQIANSLASVDSYRRGVQRTTKNPMQRAIAAIPKMKANFNKAVDSGKVQEGFESVSDADWKAVTSQKGGDNYPRGVEMARPKTTAFHEQLKQYQAEIIRQLEAMPSQSKEENRKRMNFNFDKMSQFRFVRRSAR